METCRAIRTDHWNYLHRHPDGPHDLDDLQADPLERFNRYGQPGTEPQRADLSMQLDAFFARYAEPQYDLWRGGRSKAKRVTRDTGAAVPAPQRAR